MPGEVETRVEVGGQLSALNMLGQRVVLSRMVNRKRVEVGLLGDEK